MGFENRAREYKKPAAYSPFLVQRTLALGACSQEAEGQAGKARFPDPTICEQMSCISKQPLSSLFLSFGSQCWQREALYKQPIACGVNMFIMRIRSYIWEYVSCSSGTYNNTLKLSYTDCKPCSDFCPELKQTCDASNGISIMPSDPMYTNYFKYNS